MTDVTQRADANRSPPERTAASLTTAGVRYVLSRLVTTVFYGALLFGAAGRLDWARAWLFLVIAMVGELISAAVLAAVNPGVLNQRGTLMRPGTKGFEKILLPVWFAAAYASAVVAGLDAARFDWSVLPAALIPLGIVLMTAGYAVGTWAMAVNPFFELTVRIQTERGHRTVTSGPYRFVRHPGYLGAILGGLAAPCLLGSAWMLIPIVASVTLLVLRAGLEDRALERELPGYSVYRQHTRYRLLPGIW